jgi:hypothetical protein
MINPNFFTKHENKFIEAIIQHIGDHSDVDVCVMMEMFGIKYKSTLDHMDKLIKTTSCQCRVNLSNDKQCSRSSKKDGFCMTHYKQNEKKTLDTSRIIKQTEFTKFETIVEQLRKARDIPKLVQSKLIYFDNTEYLYDPYTDFVYDFDTYDKIGKIDKFKQLKLL